MEEKKSLKLNDEQIAQVSGGYDTSIRLEEITGGIGGNGGGGAGAGIGSNGGGGGSGSGGGNGVVMIEGNNTGINGSSGRAGEL